MPRFGTTLPSATGPLAAACPQPRQGRIGERTGPNANLGEQEAFEIISNTVVASR